MLSGPFIVPYKNLIYGEHLLKEEKNRIKN
jgi:hypothetical protein